MTTPDEPTEPIAASPAPAATPATYAPGDPPAAAPPRRTTKWITPTLALIAVAVIALFGGILIGQHTAQSTQAAGFTRPGVGGGAGQGGFGQGGFGQRGNGTQGGPGSGTAPGAGSGAPTTPGGAAGQGRLGGFTAGTIQSVDGDSIVVKMADGSTVTVKTTDSTTVTKTTKSKVSDLKSGETVTVRGATTDGSVTATSITEGVTGFFGARPGAGG